MNIHFIFDTIDELNKLVLLRLSSIQKDKTNLSVSAFLNKVLNRVSSVKKLTVRSGHWNSWITASCDRVPWIVIKYFCLAKQCLDIKHFGPISALDYWNFRLNPINSQNAWFFRHYNIGRSERDGFCHREALCCHCFFHHVVFKFLKEDLNLLIRFSNRVKLILVDDRSLDGYWHLWWTLNPGFYLGLLFLFFLQFFFLLLNFSKLRDIFWNGH